VILIDGPRPTELMIEHNIGVRIGRALDDEFTPAAIS